MWTSLQRAWIKPERLKGTRHEVGKGSGGRLHKCCAKKSEDRTTGNRKASVTFWVLVCWGPFNMQLNINSSWARPSEYWFPISASRDILGGVQSAVDGKTYCHLESRAKNKIKKRLDFPSCFPSFYYLVYLWNIIKLKITNVRNLQPVILMHHVPLLSNKDRNSTSHPCFYWGWE